MEHTELLPFLNVLALLNGYLAGAHLVHSDADESHQAYGRVVSLDEDDSPRGERGQVALGGADPLDVDVDVNVNVFTALNVGQVWDAGTQACVLEERLAEVCPVFHKGPHHTSAHRAVPAVVR